MHSFSRTTFLNLFVVCLAVGKATASSKICSWENNKDSSKGDCADGMESSKLKYAPPSISTSPIEVPAKILMGPGPSTPHPRVLQAGAAPLLGHMHPEFFRIMDDTQAWLRYGFQTSNTATLAVSGTGHAAMEMAVANTVEPGDQVIVGVNGIWGERMTDIAARFGAKVIPMETKPGTVFSYEDVKAALEKNPGTKIVFVVHGESSTGTLQPLAGLGKLCHEQGALLFVDTVCTLGGVPLNVDADELDIVYSGSQKCLGAPPGASPLTLSDKATAKLAARKTKVQSYYFDLNEVGPYWGVGGAARKYHHTGMVSNVYQLREALAMLAEEGLEAAWARHQQMADRLYEGLKQLGLELFVEDPAARLPTVTTIKVPKGVNWADVPAFLMKKYKLEIAGGLGPTAGQVWRVGIMGFNAQPRNIELLLVALKDALTHVGFLKDEKVV
ncbi:Aminotransferase class V [Klebsormidium nitens]|uniref:alanine--glyoxylate transaminase n=1 Tax=Klebsormidium nitens TaxID=105231 RepID=A0A1Y1HUU1_KLENI|nr:Aminotransferase class V [Klebsormidium nitens]|eukprot:GAQ81592.1 Aminotransferase class V [Klebsormidium nitens]